MKIIHWAIIFIVLIIPFSIIARQSIQKKVLVLQDQTRVNNVVDSATYDAVSQILEVAENLGYGKNIPITYDVAMASIDRFFHTMAVNFNLPNKIDVAKDYFGQYIPAIIIVGYDGLYVYSYDQTDSGFQYVLKPKIPYSYAYKDIMINFTLGNDVTLYRANGFGSQIGTNVLSGVVSDENLSVFDSFELGILPAVTNDVSYILKRLDGATTLDLPKFLFEGSGKTQDYVYDEKTGDVDIPASKFHTLRRETIVNLISNVLQHEVNEHNTYASIMGVNYTFNIPDIDKDQWNNTINDISVMAFFQGMPLGAGSSRVPDAYYNNYSLGAAKIVEAHYIYATNDSNGKLYHKWNCKAYGFNFDDSSTYSQIFITEADAVRSGFYACKYCR